MADKKFKTGVDLQSTLTISSATDGQRVLILDASKQVVESLVTDAELGYLSGTTSAVQTQLDNKADLVSGKIPTSQLPAIAITDVFNVADIAARDALTIGPADGEVQEGDVVVVTDASADPAILSGGASYIYNGSAYSLLKSGDDILSVNGQTGVVILNPDDLDDSVSSNKFVSAAQLAKIDFISVTQAVDLDSMESDIALNTAARHDAVTLDSGDATQQSASIAGQVLTLNQATDSTDGVMSAEDKLKLDGVEAGATTDQTGAEIKAAYEAEADTNAYTDAEKAKLAAIEDLADVTDAVNVEAAGAVMEADTSTVNMSFVVDEDDMVSDSGTLVPTQQSVKAYVDNNAGNTSAGDISETSATLLDAQVSAADITGLAFANTTVRSFVVQISIVRGSSYEKIQLMAIQKGSSWDMSVEGVGDDSGIEFSITAAGQVQYISTSTGDTSLVKFRADTTTV